MTFTPFEVLCIATTVLLAVLGAVLWGSARRGVASNRHLLGVVGLNAALMVRVVVMQQGWVDPTAAPGLYYLSLGGFFALPVVVYLYLRRLLVPEAAPGWRHALGPVLGLGLVAGSYVRHRLGDPDAALWATDTGWLYLLTTNAVFLGYAAATVLLLRRTRPDQTRPAPSWAGAVGIAMLFGIHWAFSTASVLVSMGPAPSLAPWLGALSVGMLLVFSAVAVVHGLRSHPSLHPPRVAYADSPLATDDLSDLARRLDGYMREARPYLDSSLTAEELAEGIGIPVRQLSQVLSTALDTRFFAYINGFRVAEAQRLLADPSRQNETILALLYDAGFNSKSAFHRAFREATGQTPSAYRNAVLRASGDGASGEPAFGSTRPPSGRDA